MKRNGLLRRILTGLRGVLAKFSNNCCLNCHGGGVVGDSIAGKLPKICPECKGIGIRKGGIR